jgi:malonyl-CoA decarboxylase
VEVALVNGIAGRVQPLLDPVAEVGDPGTADTAIFYSINNTQTGLRGVSFGDFLIKRVVEALREELPHISDFSTLSPLPGFARTVRGALSGDETPAQERLHHALSGFAGSLGAAYPDSDGPTAAALRLIEQDPDPDRELLGAVLRRLALAYLTTPANDEGGTLDPVARFHLTNGARLERINPFADESDHGRDIAFGVMANYLYDTDELIANHERFVQRGEIPLSRSLARELKKINEGE